MTAGFGATGGPLADGAPFGPGSDRSLDFGLKGKVAIVTGGANGIGLAAARLLAGSGASVWIFDLERENPQHAAERIGAKAWAVDVTDRQSLDAAFAAAGPPDVVVANAGIAAEAGFLDH